MKRTGPPSYWLTRLCLQRSLAFIYLTVFLGSARQFRALIGEHGLEPAQNFLKLVPFRESPSLFYLNASDSFIAVTLWLGVGLSFLALTGISERFGVYFSATVWALLWLFYLSIVNIGQTFYGFGWEIMTLEAGFLAVFLGSRDTKPPVIIIWFIRWMLFRLMFGAGLIKMRGDACWHDLTCMFYYYETQPIPNPLSWYFHHQPHAFLKFQVLSTHFVELIVPWFYFWSGPAAWIAGILSIGFQGCLIVSGNLSWLNYLTIAVTIACFDDTFLSKFIRVKVPETAPMKKGRRVVLAALGALVVFLSLHPALNLISSNQMMNTSFEPLHLVNSYGAFGSVTKERTEIIFEGTDDPEAGDAAVWKEYEFKAKPGDVHRMPPLVSPYHRRLDWLMWFAAMASWRQYPWILNFVNKLLHNDAEILGQMGKNPFPEHPPHFIRAVLYSYRFTTAEEKQKTGDWWVRAPLRLYLPPLSLENERFRDILREQGWE